MFGNSAKKHFADLCRLPTPRVYYMDSHMSGASRAVYRKVFGRLAEAGCVALVRPRLVSQRVVLSGIGVVVRWTEWVAT